MSNRNDPYANYRFTVEIESLIVGGFSEVSGLEQTLETEDYQEGGVDGYTHSFPDRMTHPNLTLERGLTDSDTFWTWIDQVKHGQIERRNGRIIVMDRTGREVWGWEFREAYPVKWSGPDLNATDGTVAFESIELTHRGLSRVSGLPP